MQIGDPKWKADALRAFGWFLGSNDLSVPLVDLETGSCSDGLHPDRANENRGGESVVSYLLGLAEMRELDRAGNPALKPKAVHESRSGAPSQSTRSLRGMPCHTPRFSTDRPFICGPTRRGCVVRPFKPATEPRDFNPTDKTRANHIVDRVLALDPAAVASSSPKCSRTFRARHRNLLDTFEARADEMEDAFAPHVTFTRNSASSSARISCTSIPSKRRRCSIPASSRTRISRGRRRAACASS